MKVLALDYGSARTGLAISDASGALARPLTFVERIGTPAGIEQLLAVIAEEEPELLLVGLPVLADGTRGAQANATLAFVGRLRAVCAVPIEFEDERFTSRIAETKGGASSLDDRAAAVLLQGWLDTRTDQ
ncbi:MAG: Holliday junction resolvase RuvX [Thermoleophilia bacterium]|nr:Holliday junction resolvase RuvX [Thermoleophilia bacterium]